MASDVEARERLRETQSLSYVLDKVLFQRDTAVQSAYNDTAPVQTTPV